MLFDCHHGLRTRTRFVPSSPLSDELRIVFAPDADWTNGANPYLITRFKVVTHGLLPPLAPGSGRSANHLTYNGSWPALFTGLTRRRVDARRSLFGHPAQLSLAASRYIKRSHVRKAHRQQSCRSLFKVNPTIRSVLARLPRYSTTRNRSCHLGGWPSRSVTRRTRNFLGTHSIRWCGSNIPCVLPPTASECDAVHPW